MNRPDAFGSQEKAHQAPEIEGIGQLVEMPPYMRLVNTNESQTVRRKSTVKDSSRSDGGSARASATTASQSQSDVVLLISKENLASAAAWVPSAAEAKEALKRLKQDLPELGQGVGDLHSKLDRTRILDLLAPLVES